MTWTIPICFLFLTIMVIWFIVGCRGLWSLKLGSIMIAVIFAWLVFAALDSYKGYSFSTTWDTLSGTKALLLSWRVRGPTPQLNDPGEIFLWMIPLKIDSTLFAYNPLKEEPRAYSLPYKRSTQKSLNSLQKREDGSSMITFGDSLKTKKAGSSQEGSMSIGEGEIYQLPPPKIPDKQE
jgi:hypothetical protein